MAMSAMNVYANPTGTKCASIDELLAAFIEGRSIIVVDGNGYCNLVTSVERENKAVTANGVAYVIAEEPA